MYEFQHQQMNFNAVVYHKITKSYIIRCQALGVGFLAVHVT